MGKNKTKKNNKKKKSIKRRVKKGDKIAFVFDLDQTIGYFSQLAMVRDAYNAYLSEFNNTSVKTGQISQLFKLLKLFHEDIFRPDIWKIFHFLIQYKKNNLNTRILIYSNNSGPKYWAHTIVKYIHRILGYTLFERVILSKKNNTHAFGGVETCRKTHEKNYHDLIRCSNIDKYYTIFFFDDKRHPRMIHPYIQYI